jgi:hypothetical protein
MSPNRNPLADAPPSFRELFTPKLITVLREGYGVRDLRKDAIAGLTVAIVASIPPSSVASPFRCSGAAVSRSAGRPVHLSA